MIGDIKKNGEDDFVIVIKSTLKNKWSGTMSVIDQKVNSFGSNLKQTISPSVNLEKDIFMNKKDFQNTFSSAYITSKRPHAVADYRKL